MGESSKIANSDALEVAEAPPATATPAAIATQNQPQSQEQQQQELPQEASTSSSGTSIGMAYSSSTTSKTDEAGNLEPLNEIDRRELDEIRKLLWGDSIRVDVFRRWSQGFEFSEIEPSALVQKQGGPCAVIAPVQAYLLKILLAETPSLNLKELTADKCRRLLIEALCNILKNCKAKPYRIVTLPQSLLNEAKETAAEVANAASEISDELDCDSNPTSPEIAVEAITVDVPIPQIIEIAPDEFHERLQVHSFNTLEEVNRFYTQNFDIVCGQYGVLLFMYSVFLTKGIDNVNSEISDTSEPLIHNTYGYGSQALINLMLTGRAVAHVWDNDQDVGGLKLPGINEQNEVGFITLMEQMRYCTVGSFFKNPRNPVWVMGSETHLTVLFSNEKRLVSPETPSELARRVFKSYDPDGNNFIPTAVLQDVMASLDLVSEPEYVDLMSRRLDPEGLGIILLNAFMDEFFQQEKRSTPDTFDLLHYNGIPGSNDGNKVHYCRGSAILLECDLKSHCASNPMMTCLQTKWPNIEINWHDMRIPSLN